MTAPIGVLAMAYGTAAGPEDIERYYTDIRGGRAPSPEHLADLKGRYAAIGNRFPLLVITGQQAAALEAELNAGAAGGFRVYLGMKHSAPFIAEGVARMRADGISRAVGLVLAPHYSRLSVGGYIERVQAAVGSEGPFFTFVTNWHDHPMFVEVLASRVRDALETLTAAGRERAVVVFSAHSLPARIRDEGDPYPAQLQETADLVAAYGLIPALVLLGTLPWAAFAAWLTLPWALREAAYARGGTYPWGEAARRVRLLHLTFAILLALGVLIARAIATRFA